MNRPRKEVNILGVLNLGRIRGRRRSLLGVSYFMADEKLAAPSAVATTMCAHGSGDREMLIPGGGDVEDPAKSSPNSPNAYQSSCKVFHFPLLYPHMIFSFFCTSNFPILK